jgi:protein-disulfide isomerase
VRAVWGTVTEAYLRMGAPDAEVVDLAEELGVGLIVVGSRGHAPRVSTDVASADASGVSGTPTFFVNGRRHHGVYDVAALTTAVRAARLATPISTCDGRL